MAIATRPPNGGVTGPGDPDGPRPRYAIGGDPLRPPWTTRKTILAAIAAATTVAFVWSWNHLGMSPTVLVDGIGDMRNLLDRMLPPRFADTARIVELAVQTFFMAFLATCFASALSVPVAVLAARNTAPSPAVRSVARGIIVVTRAIPDIVFALVFVRAVGIGPLPGILAMSVHSIGMIGKLYADAIEQIDEAPREASLSTGAGPVQALTSAVLPQVLPSFIGTSLYRLDINLRISVILGVVGAGGIGFELQATLRQLVYDRGMGIVVVIAVMIVMVEIASSAVRRSIIGDAGDVPGGRRAPRRRPARRDARPAILRVPGPGVRPPWTRARVVGTSYLAVFAALFVVAYASVELSPLELLAALPDVATTVARMFPPDFVTAADSMREGMVETLAIALVATVLGVALTLPLGFLSARNVAPHPAVRTLCRGIALVVRSVPELILAIIFVAAIGLGPVAGIFALAIGTVGFMAKLMADSLEEIDTAPREAVLATGASRVQEAATSVVPQAMPAFVSNAIYMLDVNIRTGTILGIVGAGGIGFLLNNSVRTLHLQTTSAIVISLFVVVYGLELLAGWIRKAML